MTPDRWRAVDAILQRALDRAPADRPAFLADACGPDAALRREVESLLAAEPGTADSFLERRAAVGVVEATSARLAAAVAGRYAVERELGRGGMATVYLARDLRHRRPVAVKVLHPELSAALGPERFLQEIELTASLQHPHILPLFDSGGAEGLLYYVMPYVEGESLRARLARERQLPVGEAVRIAREVADALAYAHGRGVVHRDVKPENVLLQGGENAHALVADFGIALAVAQAGGERMTRTGLSLGTPHYMAPEQAAGERDVDARADVYALGAVTYEMLAGEPPFTGPTTQAVVARVLSERPAPPSRARDTVPPHVEAAVLTALEKLPADRFPSAGAFAAALAGPASAGGAVATGAAPRAAPALAVPRVAAAPLAAAFALGALAVAGAWALGSARGRASAAAGAAATRGPVRFAIEVDSGSLGDSGPAISPDGRTIVFWHAGADGARLYARRVDELAARPLPGTDDAEKPFFAPDGAWLAFYSHGAIRKVRLDGGPAVVVTTVPPAAWFEGGSWMEGDTIVYALAPLGLLYRVPARGGVASQVAVGGTGLSLTHPYILPGGRAILVTTVAPMSETGQTDSRIGVVDLASGRVRRFGVGFAPRFAAGHVVYAGVDGELLRQPFDLARLEPTGAAEQIASGLAFLIGKGVPFDASPTGTFVYRVGGGQTSPMNLKLSVTDRTGREQQAIAARVPWSPRFSPDGRRLAYGAFAPGQERSDIWITDLADGMTQRLTADEDDSNDPRWSPDGKAIVYSAIADGGKDLLVRALDGAPARALTRRPGFQFSDDWLRDGSAVLFTDVPTTGAQAGNQSIWVQPTDGTPARPYLASPARESAPSASPDRRWVAYTSNETGREEVYVQSYPTPGRKTLVSARGGVHPVWRRNGRELYYWEGEQLIAAHVDAGGPDGQLVVRGRTPLFRAPYLGGVTAMYDVSPDGSRFAVVETRARANRFVVVLDGLGARDGRR